MLIHRLMPTIVLFAFLTGSTVALADVRLPNAFGDHMVLQAEMPLPIWGEADPGEEVAVKLGGATRATTADEQGNWAVKFPPQPVARTPVGFRVQGANTIELKDVLVGEVWIAAGQSNMEWPLKRAANAKEEIASADQPLIRLLQLQGAARGGSGVYNENHFARMEPDKFCEGSWQRVGSESAKEFSAVGYIFARELQESLDVPVGIVCPAIGGTPAESWVRREALASSPQLAPMVQGNWLENPVLDEWCRKRARSNLSGTLASGTKPPGDDLGPYHSFKPGFMWEAGVAPLVPMATRGVIWYQGESNAESPRRVAQHQRIFEELVSDWRKQWQRDDLPFLFVQLPALGRPHWPAFRQSQFDCLGSLEHAGMVVTIDTGHPTNVHPVDKRPVGARLARMALGMVYERPSKAWSGPLVRSAKANGRRVTMGFDHVGQGLTSNDGQALRHFEIAGKDGKFVAANAKTRGDQIVVWSDGLANPKRVRYAWIPYPVPAVNFFNRDGLPASPFEVEVQ